jgi:hypothetical protein
MVHFLHGSILADVDVQPLRPVVHSAHATGLKHAVLLGEILLGKRLSLISTMSHRASSARAGNGVDRACCCAAGTFQCGMVLTYGLVVRVAERLAHQLGGPVLALAVLGLNTGDYEGHGCVVCCGKTAVSKKSGSSSSSSAAENRVYLRKVDCCSSVRGVRRGGRRGVYMLITYPGVVALGYLVGRGLLVQDSIDRAQAAVMGRAWWG